MICPHCQGSLKQKERPGRTCGHCKRVFALDPKEDPLRLHDLRLWRLVNGLSHHGTLRYTLTQLWYAAARKTLREDRRVPRKFALIIVPWAFGAFVVWTAPRTNDSDVAGLGYASLVVGALGTAWWLFRLHRRRRLAVRTSLSTFRRQVVNRWQQVYGGPPPHLVDDAWVPAPTPPGPVLTVLTPDRSVLACLQANDVPQRLGVALASWTNEVPAGVPVALLHDISCDGYLMGVRLRAELPDHRMVTISPRPRAAAKAKGAVLLRDAPPSAEKLAAVRQAGLLTEDELTWLGKGWWSPIAALLPAILITKVEATAARAGQVAAVHARGVDPDRSAAARVGFLTWPTG